MKAKLSYVSDKFEIYLGNGHSKVLYRIFQTFMELVLYKDIQYNLITGLHANNLVTVSQYQYLIRNVL